MALAALLRHYFQAYGYWTILVALLLENAGIPMPGETTLVVASFMAFSGQLRLPWVIALGIAAATLGDSLGYALGRYGGRPLVERYQRFFRISPQALARGERLFQRQGAVAVFCARFIFGLRLVTGPLAGALRMEPRRFLLFNFLGAVAWVNTVALVGYFAGGQRTRLLYLFHHLDAALLAALALALVWLWYRRRRIGKPGAPAGATL